MSMHFALAAVLFTFLLQEVRPLNPCDYDEIFWQTTNPANYSCLRCPTCPEGAEPSIICGSTVDYGTPLHCIPCVTGTYSDKFDTNPCRVCTICQKQRLKSCTPTSNTVCTKNCQAGYYEDFVFNCVQCPKCCKVNQQVSGCEKKECQAYQSCPSEQSTGASTNSDTVSTSPSSLKKQPESSEPTATSKSAPQLRTNSAFPARNISLSSTERTDQSNRHTPSPWKKLKSQVLNSTKSATRHLENTNTSLPYVVIISCLAILLFFLLLRLVAYRWCLKTDNEQHESTAEQTTETTISTSEISCELSEVARIDDKKCTSQESRNTDEHTCTTLQTGTKRTLSDLEHKSPETVDIVCLHLDQKKPSSRRYCELLAAKFEKLDENQRKHLKISQNPSKDLIQMLLTLYAGDDEITVEYLFKVLHKIGRKDTANVLKPWIYEEKNINTNLNGWDKVLTFHEFKHQMS